MSDRPQRLRSRPARDERQVQRAVAALVFRHRHGDANRESVWLCSRNDAIGNLVVVAAASGVFATGSYWPDVAVAAVMAGLSLSAAWQVVRRALGELAGYRPASQAAAAE